VNLMLNILIILLSATIIISTVVVLDRKITRILNIRWQLLARSALYAFAFTPTAYHHAPNTIVAPLHLSTISGNLFYGYEYTASMFVYGILLPLACGWAIAIVLLFKQGMAPKINVIPK
jgi:hypothetical protein